MPGVLEILTYENTSDLAEEKYSPGGGGSSTSIQGLGPEIAHDGQIIALVVAETYEAAREAAYKLKVTYAAGTPSGSFDSPGVTEADATKESERHKEMPQVGDADPALASADVVVDAVYGTPTQHHNPIELFTTTCVWSDALPIA